MYYAQKKYIFLDHVFQKWLLWFAKYSHHFKSVFHVYQFITISFTQKHMLNFIKFCKQLIRNVKTTRISQFCLKCCQCKQTGLNSQFSTSIFWHQIFHKIHTKTITYITHQCYTGVFSTKTESSQWFGNPNWPFNSIYEATKTWVKLAILWRHEWLWCHQWRHQWRHEPIGGWLAIYSS